MDANQSVPFAFMGIGLALLVFYGVWLYRTLRSSEEKVEENRISLFGGWFGGTAFVAGGAIMVLPPNLSLYVIAGAVVLLLSWYPLYFILHCFVR